MSTHSPTRPTERSSLAVWMAWRRYLTMVQAADPTVYAVVEESAWRRLHEELAAAGQPPGASEQFVPVP